MSKTYILVAIIISLGIIGYALISTNSKRELVELDMAQREKERMDRLTISVSCQEQAKTQYKANWLNECRTRKLVDNCFLPKVVADSYNKKLTEDLDRCMEYK